MPTIKQLIRNTRQPIRNVTKSPALRGCPQRRGTCTRVYVRLVQIMNWNKRKETFLTVSMIGPLLCMKFMVSFGINPIISTRDEKQLPIGILEAKILCSHSCKNGLTGSAT
ncbi:hypothetical protein C5167_049455 [Papaver somniferum]|uniref:Ribosomal protein S12 n=1 Tax=Papaver somniferum TaxID=3469 RepID=A0A4Y7KNQ7_PAPSO|nr:hypothetical protein C5167_049455 [Papaver somniferum]